MYAAVRIALALLLLVSIDARAQAWPTKPIHWIVPYAPGGANDIGSRLVGERLARALGQPVVIENKPGAGGMLGAELVARSTNDGYTVLSTSDSLAALPHLRPDLGFDPMKDLTPVTQLSTQAAVIAVHPSLGVKSLAELVALAKREPGIGFATAGAGSQQHILGEWFAAEAKIHLVHVAYKGGGQAVTDLVAGNIKMACLGTPPLLPFYRAGRLAILAQSTPKRTAALPDVPTFQELGFNGLVLEQWQGVFVPAGTPRAVVERLQAEIAKALADPELRSRFAQAALDPVGNTPDEFARVVRKDYEMYARLVKELGISMN